MEQHSAANKRVQVSCAQLPMKKKRTENDG